MFMVLAMLSACGRRHNVQEMAASVTTLESDVWCVQCGYDLRGLSSDGRCPECGCDVRKTLAAPAGLWQADHRWLRRVASAPLLLIAALMLANGYGWWIRLLRQVQFPSTTALVVSLLQPVAVQFMCWLACWRLAARMPHGRDAPLLRRLLLILGSACFATYGLMLALPRVTRGIGSSWLISAYVVNAVCVTALIHVRLARLAERDRRRWLMWAHALAAPLVPALTSLPLLRTGADTMEDVGELMTFVFALWRPLPGWGALTESWYLYDYGRRGRMYPWWMILCIVGLLWATGVMLVSAWTLRRAVRRRAALTSATANAEASERKSAASFVP
jgi:hypothetical protein